MPKQSCPYPNCDFSTGDVTDDLASTLLKLHADGYHTKPVQQTAKVESVRRPIINAAGTSEDWSYFITRWKDYKTATKISGIDMVIQLLECCEEDLRKDITRAAGGSLTDKSEDEVLEWIKMLAVKQENVMVARVELHNFKQHHDESIRSFGARIKGQANVCKYILSCPSCNHDVNYTNDIIKDVIIKGIYDQEIQLDLLSERNQTMLLEDVIRFIEAKEAGKRSANKLVQGVHGVSLNRSQYKKTQFQQNKPEATCSYCGKTGHGKNSTASIRKNQCPAYGKNCAHCGIQHHLAIVCRIKAQGFVKPKQKSSSVQNDSTDVIECPVVLEELCGINITNRHNKSVINMSHHVYKNMTEKWVKESSQSQPLLSLTATTHNDDYLSLGVQPLSNYKSTSIQVIPDTGCQSCLAGLQLISRLEIPKSKLIPVQLRMSAANRTHISVLGAIIVRFSGYKSDGEKVTTRQVVYITDANEKNFSQSRGLCRSRDCI